MGRNVKVIMMMLCLTVFVHVLIYHQESYFKRSYVIGSVDTGSAFASNRTNNESKPEPKGDGTLYKLIEEHVTPFTEGYPKQLVILGYQRVGSSFFGQIFDGNPSFFYVYEPLDSIYSDMYGTAGGYNVPSDIMNDDKGNPREVPEEEKAAVRTMLTNILGCNIAELSTGYLLHRYWFLLSEHFMPSWMPYRNCLDKHKLLKTSDQCWKENLRGLCSHRFGEDLGKMKACYKKLKTSEAGEVNPFSRYHLCMERGAKDAEPCVEIFKEKCAKANVWVTKTVRGTIDEMSELLENNPNMRIIHLIRDPRPVTVSRSTDKSYRGIYTGDTNIKKGGNKIHEAHMYCNNVVKDLRDRHKLQEAYPGKIVEVIYEDFIQNPTAYAEAVYKFLDEKIPDELQPWIEKNMSGEDQKHNSKHRMNAWKSKLTFVESEQITHECKEFYQLLNYKWPYD